MVVSLNILYDIKGLGNTGCLNRLPFIFKFKDSRDFTNFIRKDTHHILAWAYDHRVPVSSMCIGVSILEDDPDDEENPYYWDFLIRMKNIREYQKYKGLVKEDFEKVVRSDKINKILQ